MSWVNADKGERFDTTHMTYDCGAIEKIGSARWYFQLKGYEGHAEMSNIWPPLGSPARVKFAEFAIGHAALLGAQFIFLEEEGWDGKKWSVDNHRMTIGWHEDQAEAASAFLSMHGWWCCYNKQAEQWELERV